MDSSKIRNFCIIAHIDHGKSTLADRLLEFTHTVTDKQLQNQTLDDMDLERERGITIKSHAIQMNYKAKDGTEFIFNLIDTPGHVDFTYEVSRSLAACEGALLIVDASQGVEAQTISNLYLAIDSDLEIIPVINKIDLPSARIPEIKEQIVDLIGCDEDEILLSSAKAGLGIEEILEAIVERVPAPIDNSEKPLKALIFDSFFDVYRGAVALVRIKEGQLKQGDKIKFFSTGKQFDADEIGILKLQRQKSKTLSVGNVGYLICNIKDVSETKVGDTVFAAETPIDKPLAGFQEVKPMVFSGLFPVEAEDYEELRTSIEKLKLNDASLVYEPETSAALGFGFRCGFLGLLHMEIIQERLEREYGMNLITTLPSVEYEVYLRNGDKLAIDSPAQLPDPSNIDYITEPYVKTSIITPTEFIGALMQLIIERRGIYEDTNYIDEKRAEIKSSLPLAEIVFDFYDKLKSYSRGYASFDYEFSGFQKSTLQKLDIMLNGEKVDALSMIVHKDKAYEWGLKLCSKLKELIPRQMFEVAIQASIGSKIISRTNVRAMRKNVTAKCYGGDISRKRKLLEKQKKGKKRMKQVGSVEIPQEAFLAVLKID
ncbi:MAG: elongation factor 4 [Calditrichaeota bacterium]|nr:MAG: elongation factor 4 [Calditrichota bacterium]